MFNKENLSISMVEAAKGSCGLIFSFPDVEAIIAGGKEPSPGRPTASFIKVLSHGCLLAQSPSCVSSSYYHRRKENH